VQIVRRISGLPEISKEMTKMKTVDLEGVAKTLLPGIVFLSARQDHVTATRHLNAINGELAA
jgi:fructose-bisphosphate aldolase class 1